MWVKEKAEHVSVKKADVMANAIAKVMATVVASVLLGAGLLFSSAQAKADNPCVNAYPLARSTQHVDQQIDFLSRSYYPQVEHAVGDNLAQFKTSLLSTPLLKRKELESQWAKLLPHEKECLNAIFPDNLGLNLKLIALQDNDSDGIPDFRINYFGEFIENDIDIDNDGIDNIFDKNVFINNANDSFAANARSLPHYVNWSNQTLYSMSDNSQMYQAELFNQHSIAMVQGNVEFSDALAEVVYDTFNKVFAAHQETFQHQHPLKTIVSTSGPYIKEGPNYNWGEVPAGTQKMYLYSPVLEALENEKNALIGLLLVVHETVHGIQYAMDAEQDRYNMLRYNRHEKAPNFIKQLNELGWCVKLDNQIALEPPQYQHFVFNEKEQTLFKQLYEHKSKPVELSAIEAEYNALYETKEVDHSDADWHALLTGYNIVNAYSLTNVWEWHAEYVTVSLLDRMFKTLSTLVESAVYEEVYELANSQIAAEYGAYDIKFADKKALEKLAAQYPISKSNLEYLVSRYLIKPFCPNKRCV